MEWLFWISVAFVVYAYAGYPLCLLALASVRGRGVIRAEILPTVSLIITAHDEARRIGKKLQNTLALDYPRDRLEILVASDCSTDDTDAIIRSNSEHGVRLIRADVRRGKEHAQSLAIAAASGEILVFSDVATELEPSGVRHIVRNFADPTVGCVSSVDRMLDAGGRVSGEGAYVRYEMFLRRLETEVGSVVGLSGSFFAARREVCTPWPIDVPSDFTTVLNTVSRGMRGVSDANSIGYYRELADPRREYARKVRTVVRGVRALFAHADRLNPFRYGLFGWQLASHKLCRWLVPFALLGAAVANVALIGESTLYRISALAQALFYSLAFVALRWPIPGLRVWRPLGFLVMANVSILDAWMRLLRGSTAVTWTPSER